MQVQTPTKLSFVRAGFGTCGVSHVHRSTPSVLLGSACLGEPAGAEQCAARFFRYVLHLKHEPKPTLQLYFTLVPVWFKREP